MLTISTLELIGLSLASFAAGVILAAAVFTKRITKALDGMVLNSYQDYQEEMAKMLERTCTNCKKMLNKKSTKINS